MTDKIRKYEFTIRVCGYGENADEAWHDCQESYRLSKIPEPDATEDKGEVE